VLGKKIANEQFSGQTISMNFPENTPNGIYFIHIQLGNEKYITKIIKQ